MIKIGIAGTGSTYGIADYHLKAFLRLAGDTGGSRIYKKEGNGGKFCSEIWIGCCCMRKL